MLVTVLDINDRDNPKPVISYSEPASSVTTTAAGMLLTVSKGDIIRDHDNKACRPYEVVGKAYYLSVGDPGVPACIISVRPFAQEKKKKSVWAWT